MKIKIKKPVRLDFEGTKKIYAPDLSKENIFEIEDSVALEHDYEARYSKYPEHIEIIESAAFEDDTFPKKSEKKGFYILSNGDEIKGKKDAIAAEASLQEELGTETQAEDSEEENE